MTEDNKDPNSEPPDDSHRYLWHSSLAGPQQAEDDIEAVARKLQRMPTHYYDDIERNVITAATISEDGSKFAWVEADLRAFDPYDDEFTDVTFTLRARIGDRLAIEWEVQTYNPYFGCRVKYMKWWGDRLVMVYSEKHLTIVATLYESQRPALRRIHFEWQRRADHIVYEGRFPGIAESIRLPDLTRRLPIPVSLLAVESNQPHQLDSIVDPQAFFNDVRITLFSPDAPQPETDLLIGSVLNPFWIPLPDLSDNYRTVYGHKHWSSPVWLPLYWHLDREEKGTSAVVPLLEQVLGSNTPSGSCVMSRVHLYLVEWCAELLDACEKRVVPKKRRCAFWLPWRLEIFERDLESFPPGFVGCFHVLRQHPERWDLIGDSSGRTARIRATRNKPDT